MSALVAVASAAEKVDSGNFRPRELSFPLLEISLNDGVEKMRRFPTQSDRHVLEEHESSAPRGDCVYCQLFADLKPSKSTALVVVDREAEYIRVSRRRFYLPYASMNQEALCFAVAYAFMNGFYIARALTDLA